MQYTNRLAVKPPQLQPQVPFDHAKKDLARSIKQNLSYLSKYQRASCSWEGNISVSYLKFQRVFPVARTTKWVCPVHSKSQGLNESPYCWSDFWFFLSEKIFQFFYIFFGNHSEVSDFSNRTPFLVNFFFMLCNVWVVVGGERFEVGGFEFWELVVLESVLLQSLQRICILRKQLFMLFICKLIQHQAKQWTRWHIACGLFMLWKG